MISRTSTQRYKNTSQKLSEIANQLGVANLLEGSVQKTNDQVRVNVQLIRAENDSHLWAETYDRNLSDIFGVESEIAKRVAESLQAKLTGREEQALAVKSTSNPEAYDAYLRGLAFDGRNITSDFSTDLEQDAALKLAERAVTLVPRSRDHVSGPTFEENLALIQTAFGEKSRAISTLTQLLQTPYNSWIYGPAPITSAFLKLDPIWDSLRTDPSFQKLCKNNE